VSLSEVNFYQWNGCQRILSEPRFWLVERDDNKPISICTEGELRKAALVINDSRKTLLVLPIDKNVPIKKENNHNDEESLCDVLIQTHKNNELIVFVELKMLRIALLLKQSINWRRPSPHIKNLIRRYLNPSKSDLPILPIDLITEFIHPIKM
jgi:hypothetical protein